jgi:hypothetical protein
VKTQLIFKGDSLYLPAEPSPKMLLCIYPSGDCDRISWPLNRQENELIGYDEVRQRGMLASALFDAIETGDIPLSHERIVLLPDGSSFDIDEELHVWESSRPKQESFY